MTLENLADKVKDLRALQIRLNAALRGGNDKQKKHLIDLVRDAEKEVDEILLKHFYTPEKKQASIFGSDG